jgi:hypothetical protein
MSGRRACLLILHCRRLICTATEWLSAKTHSMCLMCTACAILRPNWPLWRPCLAARWKKTPAYGGEPTKKNKTPDLVVSRRGPSNGVSLFFSPESPWLSKYAKLANLIRNPPKRVHLWWVYRWIRRLLVATGARCPLTKPAVAAVELQATTEPHCSRGVQPGGICAYVVQREPTPGGPGRACARAASAPTASHRSGGSIARPDGPPTRVSPPPPPR